MDLIHSVEMPAQSVSLRKRKKKLSSKICFAAKDIQTCDNQLGDCRHIPRCDPRAKCVNSKKNGFQCVCNKNLKGNGQQCFDKNGNLSENPSDNVEINFEVDHSFEVMATNSSL